MVAGICLFLWFFPQEQTAVRVTTQIRNLTTGEDIQNGSVVRIGDILERSIFVENTLSILLKNVLIESLNPFTQAQELHTLNLAPKHTEIISEQIPITEGVKHVSTAVKIVLVPTTGIAAHIPFLPTNPVRVFPSSGNIVAESSIQAPKTQLQVPQDLLLAVQKQSPGKLAFWDIDSIQPSQLNNNFDAFFEIEGSHLKNISELVFQCPSKAIFLPVSTVKESRLQTLIPAFTLPKGDCQLGVKVNSIAYFSEKIVHIEQTQEAGAEVFLQNIVPNTGTVDKDSLLILQGKGFDKILAVQIDNGVVLDLQFLQKISDTTLVVNIPKGLAPGNYSFRFLTKQSVVSFPNTPFKLMNNGQ